MAEHECSILTCNQLARWQLALLVWPRGVKKSSVKGSEMKMSIVLCGHCAHDKTAADFIGDEGWAKIETAFAQAGKLPPDRDSIELLLVRLPA